MTTQSTLAPARTQWEIDPAHSDAGFAVRHLMISTVKGRFSDVRGTVRMSETDPADSNVDVTIGVASVDTGVEQRDAHLRSPDFFDAERHPVMTFRSRRVSPKDDGTLEVTGDLTIRGTTRQLVLAVTPEGRTRDPWGGERAGFSATTRINRGDFGLTYNQVLETGGVVVGDEVKINLEVELVRRPEDSAA